MKMYKTVSSNNIEWVRVNEEEYANLFGITDDIQNVEVLFFEDNQDVTEARLTNIDAPEGEQYIQTDIPTSPTLKKMLLESLGKQGIEVSY